MTRTRLYGYDFVDKYLWENINAIGGQKHKMNIFVIFGQLVEHRNSFILVVRLFL